MWLAKEERHFAVTLLLAGAGAVTGVVGLLFSANTEDVWRPLMRVTLIVLAVLQFVWVCKRRGATQYTDKSRAGEFPFTIVLTVTGTLLAALGVVLMSTGVRDVLIDADFGRGVGLFALLIGTGFAVPGVLFLRCAWVRRPTRAVRGEILPG